MDGEEAVILIAAALEAEAECAKQAFWKKRISKRANKIEGNAVSKLFKALTGRKPTAEELLSMMP